jgi:glycosyltransferase involved in cell wall biosynthesis
MATYNGARFIQQSLNSLWSQTFTDFEVIVADDCSTDSTPEILARITDPRLRVIRNPVNLGVVGSRNRCFELVRGRYVAMLDHDDLSRPRRLELQVAHLDANPGTVLVGTAAHTLTDGFLAPSNHPSRTTPVLLAWLLHVANPLICSSVMFRMDAARKLDVFLRDRYRFADDYDFYHRMAPLGGIARLDEKLTIYRLHAANTFRHHEETMTANAIQVLTPSYERWFGGDAASVASLVVRHISAAKPVPNEADFTLLCRAFDQLTRTYLNEAAGDVTTQRGIRIQANALWRRMLRVTARAGGVSRMRLLGARPAGFVPSDGDIVRVAIGDAPLRDWPQGWHQRLGRSPPKPDAATTPPLPMGRLFDTRYEPLPPDRAMPPTLWVVVDTEAEFDWNRPFARTLTDVTAMDDIGRGQAVFDHYGLRPIYVVDYPIASQPRAYEPLRQILARNGCAIGAHLHPWTTPPMEEELSRINSYPGNLPAALEAAKLRELITKIEANLGVKPVFYKAGRYGFGPATAATLAREGIQVDLSVLPGADLRRHGGPDFRALQAVPYRIDGTSIVSLPMTRAEIGLASSRRLADFGERPMALRLHLPAILARLRINETVTLTPEGVTAAEQIRLIKALLRRGQRHFVLHYHSPSLSPGHTPYVRSAADGRNFVARLETVCRYFFDEVGGLAGYPADLLQG